MNSPVQAEETLDVERSSPYYDLSLFPYTPSKALVHKKIKFGKVWFYTVFWPTPVPVKARLLFVHGLYEHSILYEELMDKLSNSGYECFFYDQRGCGLTSLDKYKGETNDRYITKDLNNFIQYNLDQKQLDVPLYLVGHSLGGGIILDYLSRGILKDQIKGGIMTAPLILSDPLTKPPFLDKVMQLVNKSSMAGNYKFTSKINKDYLTSDTHYLDFLLSDKLAIPLVSVSQLVDMFQKGMNLLKDYHINDDISLLIIHSPLDKVNSFKASQQFFAQLPTKNTRKFIETQGKHSLFIEKPELRGEVLTHILSFLDEDLATH